MDAPPSAAATPDRPATPSWFARYRAKAPRFEVGFWIALFAINAATNSAVAVMDAARDRAGLEHWAPVVWEWSSALAMLGLVPAVAWFCRRFPLHWDTLARHLPLHVAASVGFSLLHVAAMVAVREAVHASLGQDYDFGPLGASLLYEYLKDVRSYALIVAIIETYRFVVRRLQGEAALLAAPDAGEPVERVDRPERFLVRKLGREFLIAAADVEWLQASGNYVNLRVRGFDYPLRSTVAAIEARLDPTSFVRVHRSWIVNLAFVASSEPLDTGDARIHLRDGSVVPCSRTWREALRQRVQPG